MGSRDEQRIDPRLKANAEVVASRLIGYLELPTDRQERRLVAAAARVIVQLLGLNPDSIAALVGFPPEADPIHGDERPSGWQPIETAPKDGTAFLGFIPSYYQGKGGQSIVLWFDGAWSDNHAWVCEPSHWRPLPDPPIHAEEENSRGACGQAETIQATATRGGGIADP